VKSKALVFLALGVVLVGTSTSIFAGGGFSRAAITRQTPDTTNAVPQKPNPSLAPERRYLSPKSDSTPTPLTPGVYETRPYTCIVVVPGPQVDEKSIFPQSLGTDRSPRLPMRVPDLELVPRQSPPPPPAEKPASKP